MTSYQIVVCGSLVPDPLQHLEPVPVPTGGFALKNEQMLPAVLDPWAGHALFEAANLAKQNPGSKVYLVTIGPKAKLQQAMMSIAQKVPFELVAVDGSNSGFVDSFEVAQTLATAIQAIPGLDRTKLLLFGGMASASRDSGTTMQMVGEKLGIRNQFVGVDELKVEADGSLQLLERIEAGQYQISACKTLPVLVAWATGNLPEPPNNPQVGMQNMRTVLPALQRASAAKFGAEGCKFVSVEAPAQVRNTRVVKDVPVESIAREIVEWIKG